MCQCVRVSQLHTVCRHRMAHILTIQSISLLSNDSTLSKLTGMFQANLPCSLLTSCSTAAWMLGLTFLPCSTLEKSLRNQSSPPQSVPDYQFHVRATEASHCDCRPSDQMPSVLDAVTSFDKHVQLSIHSLWRW